MNEKALIAALEAALSKVNRCLNDAGLYAQSRVQIYVLECERNDHDYIGGIGSTLDERMEAAKEKVRKWECQRGDAIKDLREAISLANQLSEPAGWQDISTAPRDGTEILVLSPERPKGQEISLVFWREKGWAFFENEHIVLYVDDKITKWQPLPPAPSPEQKG